MLPGVCELGPSTSFVLSLPWLGTSVFVLATVSAAFACYALARWSFGARADSEAELFSRSMIARLGTIHGLILALMFAQEIGD